MSQSHTASRAKPLHARPMLLLQIRMLNRTATRLINWGERLRRRASWLTNDAVRAYKSDEQHLGDKS